MASRGPEARPTFARDVFPAELDEIRRRRKAVGLPDPGTGEAPSVDRGLIGLALSGGGIRSAALSLGVLQSLAARGILPAIDYVSTVSGGGLTGSCLSALLDSPGAATTNDRFPLGFVPGEPERPAVRFLRNHDRYLNPGGLLDAVRPPAVILRGLVDNLALLLPLLIAAVQLTEFAFVFFYRWGLDRLGLVPFVAAALFAIVALAQPAIYRLFPRRFTWARRNSFERLLAITLIVAVTALLGVPLFALVQQAIDLDWSNAGGLLRQYGIAISLTLGLIAALTMAGTMIRGLKALTGRIVIVLVGLLGYVAVFVLFLLLLLYQVDSPILPASLRADLATGAVTPAIAGVFAEKGYPVDVGARITHHARGSYEWWDVDVPGDQDVVIGWRGTLRLTNTLLWDGPGEWIFFGLGILGFVYAIFLTNPNVTSQHAFFRDRMSRAFMFSLDQQGSPVPRDTLKLSSLNAMGTVAPYHLINATLNLQGVTDPGLAGRDADFFLFSRHFVGSPTTGYCRTESIERYDSHLNLATAMAISGAGLAPNAGTQTVKPLVFLLTLLDMRLDYWLPNPAFVRDHTSLHELRMRTSLGPVALLKEAFGDLDARGGYVNVSDGGQIENLGVYELLRRHCRVIVALDADEDPGMTCGNLADLLRYARIDLGVEIDIDPAPLRPAANGLSAAHWVTGTIHYGANETGTLIFIKSSLTGDEPEAVKEYRQMDPAFPQDPSSNQTYGEAQFEAYRALGWHMAQTVEVRVDKN
jgi:Patatin-like phospholipase